MIASSANPRSRAHWKRSSGFFSRHRRAIRSREMAPSSRDSGISGGSSFKIAVSVSIADAPRKARSPEIAS